jgi:transposase-like protein
MKKAKEVAGRNCPQCGKAEGQVNAGQNRSGTQRCFCKDCKKYYTLGAKTRAYSEETRQQALKVYYSGVSGRGVGKLLGMSKANVYNWIKKNTSE